MKATTAPITLAGVMELIPRSRLPLAVLYEAITNALESIALRQKKFGVDPVGEVRVKLFFSGILEEAKELERVEIVDNGIGFDGENFERFEMLLDNSKGYNNRGSGRIQFLHRADQIEVTSFYREDDRVFKRHFTCNRSSYIRDSSIEPVPDDVPSGTTLALSGFSFKGEEKAFFDHLTLEGVKNAIKSHYLLRLYLDKERNPSAVPAIKIELIRNGKPAGSETITADDIPSPLTHGTINVPYVKIKSRTSDDIEWVPQIHHRETLNWAHFKLPESELPTNGVVLCSKNVPVDELKFREIKKTEAVEGHRFKTAIYGDALDSEHNVSHAVDHFTFPSQKETEKLVREDLFFDPEQEFLFFDDIEKAVETIIPGIYSELFELKERQQKNVAEIAKAHGIPDDIVRGANIGLSDNEQQITDKLYRKQADSLARQNLKIKKLFESLSSLSPTEPDYQEQLAQKSSELLDLIPPQNTQELSRYVIRRQMVVDVLRLILANKLDVQTKTAKNSKGKKTRQDREGLIHDLLFKRKAVSAEGLNDLWVLNEEFVHFDGCSDKPLNQITDIKGDKLFRPITQADKDRYGIKDDRRPDIFLYLDEAQCILIELKEPGVDLSDYLHQLPRYCTLIANFSVRKIERFYCYLIGENFSPIDLGSDYRRNVHGDWVRRSDVAINAYEEGKEDVQIASAQVEIIKLSSIHSRAKRRNRSFADKLGIHDIEDAP
ncbi:hypothetical protein [Hyphomicrobium sp.]|uniref:hypothetical protein n=1 Tax=Hyphomicrobium sp. TaxID=82 RepID=UPI002E36A3E8|nr:hypothetical protein [Hyphomicrobium sp.]HEX2839940.1 hypothetical protein [Hyphomicrobium sp.]